MKLKITIMFLLLLLPLASAVEFDMKSNFSKGETLITKISGNFQKPPFKGTTKFYRGHVRVPIDPSILKINDEFYIYAQLPENEANYSLVIEDAKYYVGSLISEDDLVQNFSISNNLADFSVDPGVVITDKDFSLEVQNLQDSKLTIQILTSPLEIDEGNSETGFFASLLEEESGETKVVQGDASVTLKSGEIEKIKFKLEDIENPVLKTITLSSENTEYEIPVYVFLNESSKKDKKRKFDFDMPELEFTMSTNSNLTKIVYLINEGEDDLENITLSISESLEPYMTLLTTEIEDLKEDEQEKIELYFQSGDYDLDLVEGQIKAKESYEGEQDVYAYIGVSFDILESYTEEPGAKTCLEVGGTICTHDQKCDSDEINAKDDKCCLTECQEIGSDTSGKIIGWAIVIIVLGFLAWFFKFKYKGAKGDISLFKRKKK
ncbi:hypothetical protein GOV13_01940 [Candidatus Pacearchaeota archaeon]|nr:hypothetical protein [Candidatus Pacearchaeota archaeon]